MYDRKELEMASCFKKGGEGKGRQKQSTCQVGKDQEEPVSHVILLNGGGLQLSTVTTYLLSRGREKIHTDSTLRHVMTLSNSIS